MIKKRWKLNTGEKNWKSFSFNQNINVFSKKWRIKKVNFYEKNLKFLLLKDPNWAQGQARYFWLFRF